MEPDPEWSHTDSAGHVHRHTPGRFTPDTLGEIYEYAPTMSELRIAAGVFALITYLVGNRIFADYLQLNFVPGTGELAIFLAGLILALVVLYEAFAVYKHEKTVGQRPELIKELHRQ